eukprot:TCALIF_08738-PA protein Name:"Similar to Eif4g2 Eukaryotic translation initiation factor 4 gamma 2 (Mus musculus)" AED:0.08 eAED:0.04 QI:597/0.5/0.2/0.8/1/0.8/5/650/1211
MFDETAGFFQVRGILNKLTPEKFEKLTVDILNVGLESTVILKGVILLIFEKALDEPKYSSMYAQLCKRLAEKAPNFDAPGKLCTFKRLLLTKCKDEFENRAQIAHENERRFESAAVVAANGPNVNSNIAPPDIEEAKYMAKRKMLGNIKFIGELGKLQIVQESVLHKCCEQLLVGRRKQPLSDQVEDLECLCHLMKTCGKLLDTPKAKVRMDQYFERLQQVTDNEQMPTRIRFLVRDLLEIRMNKWMTRRVGKTPEGPRTIQQVREDAYRDGCIYMPQANSPPTKPTNHPLGGGMGVFMNPLEGSFFDTKPKGGDLFGKVSSNIIGFIPTSSGFLGTGPGTIHADGYDEPPIELSPTPPTRPSNGFGGMDKDLGNRGPSETRAFTPNNPHNNNNSNNNNPKHLRQNSGSSSGDNSSSVHSSNADFSNFRKGGAGIGGGDNGNNRPQQQQHQQQHQNDRFNNSRGDKHLDFGDRYSANRTKDRQRRERETQNRNGGHYDRENFDNHGARDHGGDSSSFFNNRSGDGHHPRDNPRGGSYDRDEHRPSFNSQDAYDNNRWNNRLNQQDNRRFGDNNRSHFRENRDNRDRPQGGGGGGFRRDRFERKNFDNQGARDHGGDSSSRSGDGHHPRDNPRGGSYDRDEHRPSFNSQQDAYDNNRWNNRLNQQDNRRFGDNNRSHFRENRDNRDRPQGGGGGGFRRDRFERNEFPPPGARNHNQFNEDFPPAGSAMSNSGPGLLPPRLKKMVLNQGGLGGKDLEISLRPQVANNMLFKPKTPSMLPKSAQRGHSDGSPLGENSLLGPAALSHQSKIMMTTNEPLIIKQASLEKGGRKEKNRAGNKGPTRDEVFAKMETILANLLEHQSTNEAAESWKENNWLPTKMNQTAVTHFLKLTLDKDEPQRELACNLMHQLVRDGTINATHCFEGISKLMSQVSEMEKSQPAVKNHLADVAQWLVKEKLVSLKELADMLEDRSGGLYPILLLTLQRLLKSVGQEQVKAMVDKVSPPLLLVQHVPADQQSDEKLVQVLEEFQLSFLVPLLIIQQDLSKQLQMDNDPNTLFKWIQSNVDKETQEQPGFIRALFQVVVTHIVRVTTLSPETDPTVLPDKATMEQEKEHLSQFRLVLQPFVQDRPHLQLHAVYALHLFCHQKSFPKGMLLRFFINFYELDIMDEHAFLQWKEDVNEAFPGKGEALFQVNQWLTWLEEAESEEEDDDDNE